jgi:hypothetical protein
MTLLRWADKHYTVRLVVNRTDRFSRRWYEFASYRLCGRWNVFGFGLHVWGCEKPNEPI